MKITKKKFVFLLVASLFVIGCSDPVTVPGVDSGEFPDPKNTPQAIAWVAAVKGKKATTTLGDTWFFSDNGDVTYTDGEDGTVNIIRFRSAKSATEAYYYQTGNLQDIFTGGPNRVVRWYNGFSIKDGKLLSHQNNDAYNTLQEEWIRDNMTSGVPNPNADWDSIPFSNSTDIEWSTTETYTYTDGSGNTQTSFYFSEIGTLVAQ